MRAARRCAMLAAAMLLAVLSGCTAPRRAAAPACTVLLAEGEGYRVVSENPLSVLPGGDAFFRVEIEPGYTFVSCSGGAVWENGGISLPNVRYPATLTPDVRDHVEYGTLSVSGDPERGQITASPAPGQLVLGTRVTLTAQPDDGYVFAGWTAADGDDILCAENEYSFSLDADTALCARFLSPEELPQPKEALFVYDANGGMCTESDAVNGVLCRSVSTEYYKMPNCLAGLGEFVRDGYHLVEYNTRPDGTGDSYSLGSKVFLDGEQSAVLYCVWLKETPLSAFMYTEKDGAVTITGYTGEDETLVIPAFIGESPVTRIVAGAVSSPLVRTLSLPATLRILERGAFTGCTALETVYFPDSIERVSDASFMDSPFSHLYLNAVTPPHFPPGVTRKFEALVTTQDKNRIIVSSGSSSQAGLDAALLGELVGGDYFVVNYGTNAGTPVMMYLEMISHFVHEGDIVVQAPECAAPQLGSNAMTWRMYRETEGYYNIFRYIDARRYTNMLSAFAEWQKIRTQTLSVCSYTDPPVGYNEHGGAVSFPMEENRPDYRGGETIRFSRYSLTEEGAEHLNTVHDMIRRAGAVVYVSFAPYNENGLSPEAKTLKAQRAYTARFREALDATVISEVSDYALPGQYIHDSDWHPNGIGCEIRTRQLAEDLCIQMVADGIRKE